LVALWDGYGRRFLPVVTGGDPEGGMKGHGAKVKPAVLLGS
jgi:hypothetical protein